jgi:CheY-like chemotaxis protein
MDGFAACRLLAADPQTSVIPVMLVQPFALAEVLARVRIHLDRVHGERRIEGSAGSSDFSRNDLIVRAAMRHFSNTLEDPPTIMQLARAVGTSEEQA